MRNQRTLVMHAAVAALLGVAFTLWAILDRPAVTLTTMARLAPGISESQVATILGPPTADLTARPPHGFLSPPSGGRLLEYAGDWATARVEFDADVRFVRCHPMVRTVSGLERVRLRLNWW